MATKADIINDRVNTAQMELDKRAKKLQRIIAASRGKKTSVGFDQGVKLVTEMIRGQSELIDKIVFDSPKTALEQQRNLMLITGNMNQSVQ